MCKLRRWLTGEGEGGRSALVPLPSFHTCTTYVLALSLTHTGSWLREEVTDRPMEQFPSIQVLSLHRDAPSAAAMLPFLASTPPLPPRRRGGERFWPHWTVSLHRRMPCGCDVCLCVLFSIALPRGGVCPGWPTLSLSVCTYLCTKQKEWLSQQEEGEEKRGSARLPARLLGWMWCMPPPQPPQRGRNYCESLSPPPPPPPFPRQVKEEKTFGERSGGGGGGGGNELYWGEERGESWGGRRRRGQDESSNLGHFVFLQELNRLT